MALETGPTTRGVTQTQPSKSCGRLKTNDGFEEVVVDEVKKVAVMKGMVAELKKALLGGWEFMGVGESKNFPEEFVLVVDGGFDSCER